MNALVLAAGRGTRLGALTESCPKPMLPVGEIPLLERTLAWLYQAGIETAFVNTHHAPAAFAAHFGTAYRKGLAFVAEPALLGSAGAAKAYLNFLAPAGGPVLVVYGDVLFHDVDLGAFIAAFPHYPGDAMIGLTWAADLEGRSRVLREYAGRVLSFEEKPVPLQQGGELFAGLLMVEAARLAALPETAPLDFGHDVFPGWVAENALWAQGLSGEAFDIGTPAGYARAQARVAGAPGAGR